MSGPSTVVRLAHHTRFLVLATLFVLPPRAVRAQEPPAVRAHAVRAMVNRARVNDVTDLRVLILADLDRRAAVWRAVDRLGARVEMRFDELGYRRVRMHRDRILALDTIRGITSFHVDGGGDPFYDVELDFADWNEEGWRRVNELARADIARSAARPELPYRPVLDAAAFRRGSPYVPWNGMGTDAFAAAHPTFDGRGVTIAIIEKFPDFTHPAIQHALTLAGDTVRKIAGIIDPLATETPLARSYRALPNIRPIVARHVEQAAVVQGDADGILAWDGKRFHAPAPGTYRVGTYPRGDRAYPLLWVPEQRLVWLDTSGRGDFRGVAPLADFNTQYSVGMLPASDSTSPAIPFAVTIDSAGDRVRIHPGTASHTMMLVSGAAATPYPGGDLGGVAPGARVFLADYGDALNEKLEAFIRAARRPDVDIVTCSCVFGTFPDLGEGFSPLVLDRIVNVYRKPVIVGAGNSGPMLTEVQDVGATDAISVGAYSSSASFLAHQGIRLGARHDWVTPYSAWGPGGNGALKPDVLAPMNAVVANPCSVRAATAVTVYRLPPCHRLGGGTSMATPVAAGAAALLVSAARQEGVPHDATRIAWALRGGARYLPQWPAMAQGAGLVRLPAAWELLRSAVATPVIDVRGPVRHGRARHMRMPGVGPGIFERDGWRPGMVGEQVLTLTRRSGPRDAVRYGLTWIGNDGTFASDTSVILPLLRPVPLKVRVQPATHGAHGAILALVDSATGAVVRHIATTVVAAEALEEANDFTVRDSAVVAFPVRRSLFVNVPPGMAALRVTLRVKRGRLDVNMRSSMATSLVASRAFKRAYAEPVSLGYHEEGEYTQLLPRPDAGAWELSVGPSTNPPDWMTNEPGATADAEYVLTVQGLAAHVAVSDVAASRDSLALELRNAGAPMDGALTVVEHGAMRVLTGRLPSRTASAQVIPMNVDSGTATLLVRASMKEPGTEAFLYLYDCTGDRCRLWDLAIEPGATKEFVVRDPRPGVWKLLIDPVVESAAGAAYEYTEVVTGSTTDAGRREGQAARRAAGEMWRERHWLGNALIPAGSRQMVAVVELLDVGAEGAERQRPLGRFLLPPQSRPLAVGRAVIARAGNSRAH